LREQAEAAEVRAMKCIAQAVVPAPSSWEGLNIKEAEYFEQIAG
jgi:hypothetical protein